MRFLVLILFLNMQAFAESFESRVSEIHQEPGEDTLVLFENGRVGFMPAGKTVTDFSRAQEAGENLLVQLDSTHTVLSVMALEEGPGRSAGQLLTGPAYEATELESTSQASAIFSHMKQGWQDESQCYNRAHVWAYEAYQNSGLKSIKLFLFFTTRYIRNYRFNWWFHVAPMTLVRRNGKNYPKVLDRRYTSGPRDIQPWTNIFVKSKASCPLVKKYSDYRRNQNSADCYLLPASMYYYQPRDLERLERSGRTKTGFIQSEVNWAYREAF